MRKTPYPHQEKATQATFKWFENSKANPLVVVPVGGGKSLLMAEFIGRAQEMYPGTRFMVATHVKELLVQNSAELMNQYPNSNISFWCAGLGKKSFMGDVIFASVQSVAKKVFGLPKPVEILIVDECFTEGTEIETPAGKKKINLLRCGDVVYNATGVGKITATSVKKASIIYKLRFSNGKEARCTGNHPFFTEEGWKEARKLREGEEVYSIEDMSKLWNGVFSGDDAAVQQKSFLHNILFKEEGKRHVDSWSKGEDAGDFAKDRSQAICSWWERKCNCNPEKVSRNVRGGVDIGTGNPDEGSEGVAAIPNMLQGRFGEQREDDSYRAGWNESQWEKKASRPQERFISRRARLESVEIEEPRCGELVYNIQVDRHPSYFANGFLVHNCHLISHKEDTSYQLLIKNLKILNPKLKVIGYTGTAFRPNGDRLDEGDGAIFGGAAYEIPMQYLIDKGFLCPLVTPTSIKTKMSVSGVGTRNGDYIESQLQEAVDKDEITKACVDEIIEYGQDRKKWLIFTSGLKHCEHVRDEIRSRGISCEMVHGEMDKAERDRIIARYKTDEIRCMVNVAVLTTGFNHPPIDLLAYMRPTRSPVLYVQCSGRGMRTAPGKTDCLVLDFGGVIETLGPVDTIDARMKSKGQGNGDGDAPTKVCPVCSGVMFAGVRECPDCAYVFPDNKADLFRQAVKDAAILASQEKPTEYEVLSIDYTRHEKEGKPPSMCVRYTTLGGSFKEWVCFEHKGFAGDKARAWHYKRLPNTKPPTSVDEALKLAYPAPCFVSVRRGIKYTEITGHRFDYIKKEPEPISPEAVNLLLADDIPF